MTRRTSGGPFLTVPEVATAYGVEQATVRKWLYRGRVLRGPRRTVDAASLEHYLAHRGRPDRARHAKGDQS